MDHRTTTPGERITVLRRAGVSAAAVVLGAAIGIGLSLSAPLVPAAQAGSLFADQQPMPHRLTRAGPVQEAQANVMPKQDLTDGQPNAGAVPEGQQMQASTPLTHDDMVKVQQRLKSLGYDPGSADGQADQSTGQALNDYRKSLGLQPVQTIDRQAVAPLTP